MEKARVLTAGDQGIVVEFGESIDAVINGKVHRMTEILRSKQLIGLREVVPTYRSLLIYFDSLVVSRQELAREIEQALLMVNEAEMLKKEIRHIKIPVCYGGEYGPDIQFVANHNGLREEEVVEIHSGTAYLVYMLGFTPGFPYLGGMSDRIATPRLENPRTVIPAGSVGIAGKQTGFYPIASPGGWQLIGRTPVKAFDSRKEEPFLFGAGDYLQFYPISPEIFIKIQAQVEAGAYEPEVSIVTDGGGA